MPKKLNKSKNQPNPLFTFASTRLDDRALLPDDAEIKTNAHGVSYLFVPLHHRIAVITLEEESFQIREQHLSIYSEICAQDEFASHHFTMEMINSRTQRIDIVHVYFNRSEQLIKIHRKDSDGKNLLFSPNQKDLIQEWAEAHISGVMRRLFQARTQRLQVLSEDMHKICLVALQNIKTLPLDEKIACLDAVLSSQVLLLDEHQGIMFYKENASERQDKGPAIYFDLGSMLRQHRSKKNMAAPSTSQPSVVKASKRPGGGAHKPKKSHAKRAHVSEQEDFKLAEGSQRILDRKPEWFQSCSEITAMMQSDFNAFNDDWLKLRSALLMIDLDDNIDKSSEHYLKFKTYEHTFIGHKQFLFDLAVRLNLRTLLMQHKDIFLLHVRSVLQLAIETDDIDLMRFCLNESKTSFHQLGFEHEGQTVSLLAFLFKNNKEEMLKMVLKLEAPEQVTAISIMLLEPGLSVGMPLYHDLLTKYNDANIAAQEFMYIKHQGRGAKQLLQLLKHQLQESGRTAQEENELQLQYDNYDILAKFLNPIKNKQRMKICIRKQVELMRQLTPFDPDLKRELLKDKEFVQLARLFQEESVQFMRCFSVKEYPQVYQLESHLLIVEPTLQLSHSDQQIGVQDVMNGLTKLIKDIQTLSTQLMETKTEQRLNRLKMTLESVVSTRRRANNSLMNTDNTALTTSSNRLTEITEILNRIRDEFIRPIVELLEGLEGLEGHEELEELDREVTQMNQPDHTGAAQSDISSISGGGDGRIVAMTSFPTPSAFFTPASTTTSSRADASPTQAEEHPAEAAVEGGPASETKHLAP